MCNFKVSPNHCRCDLTTPTSHDQELDAMIDVFGDRVCGWFLDQAEFLQKEGTQHVGFSVLMILFSYFEQYAQYKKGEESRGRSEITFREGFLSVFPELNSLVPNELNTLMDIVYKSARCGFYHSGMTKWNFFIRDNQTTLDPIVFESNKVYVDRFKFLARVKNHFENYVLKLRDKSNTLLRENFEKFWKLINEGKIY